MTTETTPSTATARQPLSILRGRKLPEDTMAALYLSVPLQEMCDVEAELATNPKDGPRYRGGDQRYDWKGTVTSGTKAQHDELRFSYCLSKVQTAIEVLAQDMEALEWDADATIAKVTREAEAQAREEGRLDRFDKDHDITEFGGLVGEVAGWRGDAEEARRQRDESIRLLGKGRSLKELHDDAGPPQWQIRRVAVGAIRRWLPAVQNMVNRLPPGERQAAKADAEAMLRRHLLILCKLHTLCKKPSDEYRRWEEGFGAVDQAIIQSFGMVGYALDLSERMQDDGTDLGRMVGRLQRRTQTAFDDARKALQKLAVSRLYVLDWFARRRKTELVEFARANGGIAPSLEVKYHAKGSGFVAY